MMGDSCFSLLVPPRSPLHVNIVNIGALAAPCLTSKTLRLDFIRSSVFFFSKIRLSFVLIMRVIVNVICSLSHVALRHRVPSLLSF